jgi:hypothetical protein
MESIYLPKPQFPGHAKNDQQDVIPWPSRMESGAAANDTTGLNINGNEIMLPGVD